MARMTRVFGAALLLAPLVGCSDDPTGPGPDVGEWVELAVGRAHACALGGQGAVFCWGSTSVGQAGQPAGPVLRPARVSSSLVFTQIDAGGDTTCGVTEAGSMHCWGNNALGQFGDESGFNSYQPTVAGGATTWSSVSVGTYHVCGIDSGGQVHCWGGDRWDAVLGYPATKECVAPIAEPMWPCQDLPMPDLSPGSFAWVEAGLYQTCAGSPASGAVCWGTNDLGQLGTSVADVCLRNDPMATTGRPCSRAPVAPDGPTLDHLLPGSSHSCGLAGSDVYCWGATALDFGQIGDGALDGAPGPVLVVAGGPWRAVFTSHENNIRTFSCGIQTDGAALCWGAHLFGQLGSGAAPDCGVSSVPCRAEPTPVEGGHAFLTLALGGEFACGITDANEVLCWGQNAEGQLGDGTQDARYQPAAVAF